MPVVLPQLNLVLMRGAETFLRLVLQLQVQFFLAGILSLTCDAASLDSSVMSQRDFHRYRQSHNEGQVHLTTNTQSGKLQI